jgi:hypothetical protein
MHPELLLPEQLKRLQADIMEWVDEGCRALEREIEATAVVEHFTLPLPNTQYYDVFIRAKVLDVILEEQARLKAPGACNRSDAGYNIQAERAERKKLRNDYVAACKLDGVKVTDEMIAKAANPGTPNRNGWNTRDSIQKWLQCNPNYDGRPDRMIRDVFKKKPHLPKSRPKRSHL